MNNSQIHQQLVTKEVTVEELTKRVIKEQNLLPEIFDGLKAEKASIKYGCLKVLCLISEQQPVLLYPYFNFFVELLDSEVNIFKWGGILIIANLTVADTNNKFELIFEKYYAPITEHVLISAANVVRSSGTIALAKPELTERITEEVLKVDDAVYETDECRNIAIGHAIKSFHKFFVQIKNKQPVIDFINRQLENSRSGTKKAAEKFVKKYAGTGHSI
ncbi:hypothetical protein H8E88_35465 [candidate division KSB1 bacterium]|nr:hypothetical protein [candidate division KSB1 bacterium]